MPNKQSAQQGLPITQFGPIKFPGETHKVAFAGRHHVHEYPHTPGGNVEKLGRSLYKVTIRGNFQATFPGFPDLYPNGMNTIRGYAEQMQTLTLVHPTLGSFPAFIIGWEQVKDARLLSGEKVDITFLEDQAQQFQLNDVVADADDTTIGPSAAQLDAELAAVRADLALSSQDTGILDAIQSVVTQILAIGDTVTLYGNDYSAKLQQLAGLCSQMESAFSMQDARAWPVVNAIMALWNGANLALQDLQSHQAKLSTYIVEQDGVTLTDCAIAIYGDASRASDLLGLNPTLPNVLSIPATTQILYYPDSPTNGTGTLTSGVSPP